MSARETAITALHSLVLSWAAVPIGLALTWVAGRFFASMLGWS